MRKVKITNLINKLQINKVKSKKEEVIKCLIMIAHIRMLEHIQIICAKSVALPKEFISIGHTTVNMIGDLTVVRASVRTVIIL